MLDLVHRVIIMSPALILATAFLYAVYKVMTYYYTQPVSAKAYSERTAAIIKSTAVNEEMVTEFRLYKLSSDAKTAALTELAERIMRESSSAQVIAGVNRILSAFEVADSDGHSDSRRMYDAHLALQRISELLEDHK